MASSSSTRRILYAVGALLLVVLLAGGAARWMGWVGGGFEGLQVEVGEAEQRDITQVVTAFGRAQPEVEVAISPDVSGEIVELPVEEGQMVEQGDLLARLNQENPRAVVEQQRANVSQSKASLAERRADSLSARLNFNRQKGLYDKGVISESEYETARSQYQQAVARLQAARFQVQSAQASLQDALERLEKTRIYAPMSGTVSTLNVEQGERVVGTERVQGTEMMTIAQLDQMEMEVDVNESDVVNVSMTDSAAVEIDAYPDESFQGTVTEIANSARVSNEGTQDQVTNFPVKVRINGVENIEPAIANAETGGGVTRPEVPNPPHVMPKLRPGMSGTVEIFTQTVPNAVAVPIQAVTVRDFNTVRGGSETGTNASGSPNEDLRKVVFVAEADSARMVEVSTGIADETHIEIRSGLSGGERVIVGPYSAVSRDLSPGDKIRVDSDEEGDGGMMASGL